MTTYRLIWWLSSDGIFDETRFSSISRPKDLQVSTNIQEVDDDQLQSQDFPSNSVDDETRLSFDFNVNEADKCVYSKFDDKDMGLSFAFMSMTYS